MKSRVMNVYNEKNGDIVLSSKHVFSVQSNVEKQKKLAGNCVYRLNIVWGMTTY